MNIISDLNLKIEPSKLNKYLRSSLKNWCDGYYMKMMGLSCLEEAVLIEKRERYMSVWTSQTDNRSKQKKTFEKGKNKNYITLESTLLTTRSCEI